MLLLLTNPSLPALIKTSQLAPILSQIDRLKHFTATYNRCSFHIVTRSACRFRKRKKSRKKKMASQQPKREDLDERARLGETVVPGGTGGKSYEAQQNLAEGRSKGGQTRKEQLGTAGYQEMGRKGGLSTLDRSGGERAAEEGIDIDESKFINK